MEMKSIERIGKKTKGKALVKLSYFFTENVKPEYSIFDTYIYTILQFCNIAVLQK